MQFTITAIVQSVDNVDKQNIYRPCIHLILLMDFRWLSTLSPHQVEKKDKISRGLVYVGQFFL